MSKTAAPFSFQNRYVLVVDDDPFTRAVVVHILRSLHFSRIAEAPDAKSALALLKGEQPDVIITDVEMPGMNGLEFIKRIRTGQTPATPDARIVVLTLYSNVDVLSTAIALDANGFLVKPISISIAQSKLEQAIMEPFAARPSDTYLDVLTDTAPSPSKAGGTAESRGAKILRQSDSIEQNENPAIQTVGIQQLQPDMLVAQDIFFRGGPLLLSAGHVLTQSNINRLKDLSEFLQDRSVKVRREQD